MHRRPYQTFPARGIARFCLQRREASAMPAAAERNRVGRTSLFQDGADAHDKVALLVVDGLISLLLFDPLGRPLCRLWSKDRSARHTQHARKGRDNARLDCLPNPWNWSSPRTRPASAWSCSPSPYPICSPPSPRATSRTQRCCGTRHCRRRGGLRCGRRRSCVSCTPARTRKSHTASSTRTSMCSLHPLRRRARTAAARAYPRS